MKRIILADDHSFIRRGLIQILKDEYPSAEIKEVGDGESLILKKKHTSCLLRECNNLTQIRFYAY